MQRLRWSLFCIVCLRQGRFMIQTLLLIMSLLHARPDVIPPNKKQISAEQMRAANVYAKIITGMEIIQPVDERLRPNILNVKENPKPLIEQLMQTSSFYDIRIANFVSRIGNEQEEPYEDVDDYQIALTLAIRDNIDFRSIFIKPFFIKARGDESPIRNRDLERTFEQDDLSASFLSSLSLEFDNTQMKEGTVGNGYMHDGLMSSQGFGKRFISNGTNRRPIRAVYDIYLCSKIESYMDTSLSDMFVGPDISRNPGGNPHEYQQKCSGCHAVLDSQRGAFAHYDQDENDRTQKYVEVISEKYNRNQQNNPEGEGYQTVDAYWVNPLSSKQSQERFGWRTPLSGIGVLSFANMIVQSEQFQRCITKKMIAEFCDRSPTFIRTSNKEFIALAESFRNDGYKMKNLISKIAMSSYCR
jgi:hypothetical protein